MEERGNTHPTTTEKTRRDKYNEENSKAIVDPTPMAFKPINTGE